MMQKKGLTIERHKELGQELFDIRDKLVNISCELGRAYPVKAGFDRQLGQVIQKIDAVRGMLDEHFYNEHPKDFNIRIYYPGISK
jgi:hypothetical protein